MSTTVTITNKTSVNVNSTNLGKFGLGIRDSALNTPLYNLPFNGIIQNTDFNSVGYTVTWTPGTLTTIRVLFYTSGGSYQSYTDFQCIFQGINNYVISPTTYSLPLQNITLTKSDNECPNIQLVFKLTSSTGVVSSFSTGSPVATSIPFSSFTPQLTLVGTYTTSITQVTANTYVTTSISPAQIFITPPPPCFLPMTRILTPLGYRLVETLSDYDQVETGDGRSVAVKVFKTYVARTNQDTAPYCIPRGAIADGVPDEDLHVSGLHAIQDARGMWQFPMGLAMAHGSKVQQHLPGRPATYYHLECPNYFTDNLIANGCVAESFRNKQGREGITFEYCEEQQGFVRNREDEIKEDVPSDVLAVYC